MKLPQFFQRKWNYTALAFLLPVIGILMVMLISQYAPFGKYSILYSDMYHQYYPFFLAFRRALLSGDSLLYSWNIGLGMDYLGLISYYLASPLNLLSIFVPESWGLTLFSFLMPLKLGFSGMFFAIFLKKIFKKDDFSITLFGCFYALCAWALGFQWNIMWLDTFALLPLIALGTVSLLRDKKFILYTVTLFLSIYANYYIGFFTCIFVLLLFICYQICRWESFSKFCADLLRIAVFSALAIGMTAILSLPTLAALQTTQSSVNKFPNGFKLNIADSNTWKGLLDAMRQVAGNTNGGLEPTYKEGLPNLYCGIGTNIFAILFLTCRQVKLRDKLCSIVLLLFFNVSFIIRQLDYIWHGFHFTNMIPYRFSFLYSFVMLYMAYRAYLLRHRIRLWQILLSGLMAIGIAFCSNSITDPIYWAYNGVFLLLYLSIPIYVILRRPAPSNQDAENHAQTRAERHALQQTGTALLSIVMIIELVLNLINFGLTFTGSSISNYPKGAKHTASVIRYMKERESDNLFYRAETTHSQTLNDGALNNYNGISTFTSSANVKVTEFMRALGYGAKNTYNRYCFEESSPVSNLFIGLKYMLERDGKLEDNPYFDVVYNSDNVYLLENNAYLPLGFLANSQLLNINIAENVNPFIFQNKLLREATGINQNVWIQTKGNALLIQSDSDIVASETASGHCSYDTTALSENTTLTYSYTISHPGFMCIRLDLSKRNNFSVWKNGIELYSETYSIPQMLAVSEVAPGDVVEVKLTCKPNEKGSIDISAAILNEEIFREAHNTLAASTLELTEFRNTHISGTINCNRSGVLYTSIPQNGNWRATVDGNPAEIVLIGDAMVGLLLPEGEHTVSFHYQNRAFAIGWKISLACLVLLCIAYFTIYQPSFKRKKGKYER